MSNITEKMDTFQQESYNIKVKMSKEELKLKALDLALRHCISLKRDTGNEHPLMVYSVKAVAQEYLKFLTDD